MAKDRWLRRGVALSLSLMALAGRSVVPGDDSGLLGATVLVLLVLAVGDSWETGRAG